MKKLAALATAVVLGSAPLVLISQADAAPARTFRNCTELNRVYPHGVGKPGARDRTSGRPVTTFKRSRALYLANQRSDRDRDGIACEKR